ncbi:Uncharacterised protein [Mycobacterium tuberculosis]|nr:Uncharacterised protein [Mycobacterium tuberculosis]
MRDRQPVDPTALAAQPISDRAHRIVGTRDHHRSRTIDRRDAHIVPQHRRYLVFTGLHRKHGAAGGQRLHQPSTRGHQHRRIRQTQRPGDVRRGQLAHRMTQPQPRPHPPRHEQPIQRHLHRKQRRLGEFGGIQQILVVPPDHIAQRIPQVPVQLVHHSIEGLGENRVGSIKLATHTQPLRALTGKHKSRLARRLANTADHPSLRPTSNHPSQPSQQLIASLADHHRPMIKHRPRAHQRIPHINNIKRRPSPHIPPQPTRLSSQRRSRLPRNHPRHHPTTGTANIRAARNRVRPNRTSFLDNHMRIGAAKAER